VLNSVEPNDVLHEVIYSSECVSAIKSCAVGASICCGWLKIVDMALQDVDSGKLHGTITTIWQMQSLLDMDFQSSFISEALIAFRAGIGWVC